MTQLKFRLKDEKTDDVVVFSLHVYKVISLVALFTHCTTDENEMINYMK